MTLPDETLCGSGDGLPAVEYAYPQTCPIKGCRCAPRCAATMGWLQAHAEHTAKLPRQKKQ